MGKLDGKVAIITGGASGIGEATVRLFVEEGAHVLIADVKDEKGQRLAEQLGTSATFLHTDVSRESDVKAAITYVLERFGRLDCMFNNAGRGGVGGSIEGISVEAFDKIVGVLFRGVFLGMKHAAPVMKRQGYGSIINTASIAGLRTGWGPHVYSATKAAVIHLTRSVAMELGESGVRVNCICPGATVTPIFFGRRFDHSPDSAAKAIEALKAGFTNLQPIRRAGLPEDIAQAALWLASEDASFVNGHALVVDGGAIGGKTWSESQEMFARLHSAMGLGD
jgi:NAD(P)-dependent dehydrogenase (short-subunit alcohol dehydrogenase family)